jgi:hypothetical protein
MERGPKGVRSKEPASIGIIIKQIKKRQKARELGIVFKSMLYGFARDGIEHVDNVKEEHSMGRGCICSKWA